eukprot:Phypoly_transcript_11491.p1 GENE.Phypoly_transcript_11491~~Phypoly_transcript_11491.p1  ORF type:complete len:335 (+),score=74.42 Phypoly_transcript_11491:114-1118(+)
MQFNPACLSGTNNSNNISCAEYLPTGTNTFSDSLATQNAWSNVITSLPFYGIYNPSSLMAVPPTTQDVSPLNIPVVSPSMDANKKKVSPKRPNELMPGEKLDEKTQAMDEEQKMKRQRRLLKNREAAQQFRQRQKEYIQNLERKVTELNTHVGETHKHIELLSTENRLLRDQLVYLYNVMRQNLSLSPTSPTANSPTFSSSISSSPIPPPPAPPANIDLGLLGFKGFDNMNYEEMLKNSSTSPTMQHMMNQTPVPSPSSTPAVSPSITPSLSSPVTPRIPDLATLSIAKGLEMETFEASNPMLISRFGSLIKTDHEAQTVPELAIKAEGGGGNM